MPSICPHCSRVNFDQASSCIHCGTKLPMRSKMTGSFAKLPALKRNHSPAPNTADQLRSKDALLHETTSPVSQSSGSHPTLPTTPQPGAPTEQPANRELLSEKGKPTTARSTTSSPGIVVSHHSWLVNKSPLDTVPIKQEIVRAVITEKVYQQQLEETRVSLEEYHQKDGREERTLITIRRKATSGSIYVTTVGNNLYISRTISICMPFNPLRVILLIVLTALVLLAPLYGYIVLQQALTTSFTQQNFEQFYQSLIFSWDLCFILSILYVPLLLLFIAALGIICSHWIREKDPFRLLRSSTLHPFQYDDIAILEHIIDTLLHESLDYLGLPAVTITPARRIYQPGQRFPLF
ncbi:hypothetical protein EI42_00644 [Thermosporothrix hazakensis]|uniref:Uncharacterized protein n=2 Tax=Thermosporothrix hazakensis TaxID=644383 RepID=A0A326UHZ8_THEHA|nr:hypothetical protein EI42_00644 [Thermosporothrix hazakensis]